jgi:hypothetical protein
VDREIFGLFHKPLVTDERIKSKLTIAGDGSSSLEGEDIFSEGDNIQEDVLYGRDEDGHFYSLLHLLYNKKTTNSIGAPRTCKLTPRFLVVSTKHVEKIEDIAILSFRFRLDCNQWFRKNLAQYQQKHLPLTFRPVITLNCNDDLSIEMSSRHDFDIGKRKTTVSINSLKSQPLKAFQDAAHYLITFLSFACRSALHHGDITLEDSEGVAYELYYKPGFFPENSETDNNLFTYFEADELQDKFSRWIALYDAAPAIFKLYFLNRLRPLDTTVRFLMAAQSLECFHRILLDPGDVSFANRVKQIVEDAAYHKILVEVGGSDEIESLNRKILGTRNYFTHYRDYYKENSNETDVVFLNFKAELLIDLYLLSRIGFTPEHFESIKHSVIDDRLNRRQNMNMIYLGSKKI